ncbi:Protein-tyrosine phosphatase [Halanaeroarchaeum sp. HSR-CO]|uniref:protein-tyrosine phosphatase family protein n=1 Tax=Halanaeroarchaeum sp. HSR-CO TaxID=2866382 RepID=UPI00217F0143|nr:dual specificity protein phosphatase [Halanaeroarchaeum sp. HSR-CO]UWG49109.1 Protein-tyrosine phosphatase [Halanaeroarchaeum sp. HSR-CO]
MPTDERSPGSASDEPVVRPVGYVEDRPVIRRIGDRPLFIGNWRSADSAQHDRRFEYVVSATQTSYPLTTHHHPLIDGPENEWPDFEAAVDTTRRLYRADGSLLVHCKAGVSRSTTLLATTIAMEEDRSLDDAIAEIRAVRPVATPNPALVEQAVTYLAAHG